MLVVKNLYLAYSKDYFTLNDINLEFPKGRITLILGEKDSGKSSLIRVIAGLEPQTKGEVLVNNIPITTADFKNDIKMGYLSSFGAFLNNKSVKFNLEYVLKIRGYNKDQIHNLVSAALLTNKLESIADIKIKKLTEFVKLKVAIARLSLRPLELLVIDDIFENYSEKEIANLAELVKDLIERNSGCTVIMAISNLTISNYIKGNVTKLKYGSIVE